MSSDKPVSIDFRTPSNKQELLAFLSVSDSQLEEMINKTQKADNSPPIVDEDSLIEAIENFDGAKVRIISLPSFFKHYISKKSRHRNKEYRIVWEAREPFADAYKTFARRFDLFLRLADKRYPHPCAYGYVRGRSTIENALPHCGKSLILHADIKDFFPSISADRLHKKFLELGIQQEVADILKHFVTIDSALPLGLHPSPILANMICLDLDDKLDRIAQKYGCSYTRYADDISISGNHRVPSKEEIGAVLAEEGFVLSERKFRITKPGQAHYVTGLSVTDKRIPRAPRAMKKRLRLELHYCERDGIVKHLSHIAGDEPDYVRRGVNRIDGTVRYIANIEEDEWPTLRQEWNNLLKRDGLEPSYASIEDRHQRSIILYIDESVLDHAGKKSMAMSMAMTEDYNIIAAITAKILREHLADPFTGGKKEALEKKKMHYADANEDLRKKYIDNMSVFPFRGYLAYGDMTPQMDYETLYLSLFRNLLKDRLMGCDGASVLLVFEENSSVRPAQIKQTVEEVYAKLKKTDNRRPVTAPKVVIGKKDEHSCFAVPDFLLGVWGDYIKKHDTSGDRTTLHFEKLRDKYRVILDANRNICFSRKRPFLPKYWHENHGADLINKVVG